MNRSNYRYIQGIWYDGQCLSAVSERYKPNYIHTYIHTYIHSIDPWDCHKTMGCGTRNDHTAKQNIQNIWRKKEIYSVELHCTDLVLCVYQYSDKKHSKLMYYTALISYYPLYNNSLPFRDTDAKMFSLKMGILK